MSDTETFKIGDRIRHNDAPNNLGTIVGAPDGVWFVKFDIPVDWQSRPEYATCSSRYMEHATSEENEAHAELSKVREELSKVRAELNHLKKAYASLENGRDFWLKRCEHYVKEINVLRLKVYEVRRAVQL